MKRLIFIGLLQVLAIGFTFAQVKAQNGKDSLKTEVKEMPVKIVHKDSLKFGQLQNKTPFDKGKHKFSFATSYIMAKEAFSLNKNISLTKFNLIEKPKVDFSYRPAQQQVYFFAIYDYAPIPNYLLSPAPDFQPYRDRFAYELRTIGYQPGSYDQDRPALLFFFVRTNKHLRGWGWDHLEPRDKQTVDTYKTYPEQQKPIHQP